MSRKVALYRIILALTFLAAGTANAAMVSTGPGGFDSGYATRITYENDSATAKRGTADGRADPLNALGAPDGKFFEIGLRSTIELTFGVAFISPGSGVEVTFGTRSSWLETANVFVGRSGSPGSFVAINEGSITNQTLGGLFSFTFSGGPFDTVRIVDTSSAQGSSTTGGFDIDSVRITPVPLPLAGFLLDSDSHSVQPVGMTG